MHPSKLNKILGERPEGNKYPFIQGAQLLNCGWDFLLEGLYDRIQSLQTQYLRLAPQAQNFPVIAAPAGKPIFKVRITQVKEKWGQLRVYLDVEPEEFDWSVFDKDHYALLLRGCRDSIEGYIDAIERVSGFICMRSGERGTRRNIDGWYVTLSDQEYEKACQERESRTKV